MSDTIQANAGLFCKVRLFGKEVTAEEARKFLVDKVTHGEKIATLARDHGMTTKTIYRYLEQAKELGEITKQDGKWVVDVVAKAAKEFEEFNKLHPITENPLVKAWQDDLKTRKDGGPIVREKEHIQALENFCNYMHIQPEQLVYSKSKEVVKGYMKNFSILLQSGKTDHKPTMFQLDGKTPNYDFIFKRYKDAIRSFVQLHGISLPKGESGVLSNKVIGHGKYADIKLTDEELHIADNYLLTKYGATHPIYLLFWVGVESCARKSALLTMRMDWVETITKKGIKVFTMVAYESKTKHINGGKWTKYIRRTQTQEALMKAKLTCKTGLLYEKNKTQMYAEFIIALKDLYKHLGKTDPYFFKHAAHALRHIGAHFWLRKTNYNYAVVAKIGGWHTIDELIKSYGEMPADVLFDTMDEGGAGLNTI